MRRNRRQRGRLTGTEGVDFVSCRICGERHRVINGRHLSKHDTDREGYMKEYGLGPDELLAKSFRVLQSSHREYEPCGKKEWIAAIQKLHNSGGSIFAGELQDNRPYLYKQGVWLFGNWDDALRTAGFEPEQTRIKSFWNDERLNREIRRLRQQKLPLYPDYVMKHYRKIFSKALRRYGTWEKALLANAITPAPKGFRFVLLRELRDAIESRKKISEALRSELDYYFGCLQNARHALKIDKRLLSGWSKRKIILLIQQRHRLKQSLGYGEMERVFPALLSAGQAYFGSWGNALYASGVDPNEYFVRVWRKRTRQTPPIRARRNPHLP
jgi:hypothetical protein